MINIPTLNGTPPTSSSRPSNVNIVVCSILFWFEPKSWLPRSLFPKSLSRTSFLAPEYCHVKDGIVYWLDDLIKARKPVISLKKFGQRNTPKLIPWILLRIVVAVLDGSFSFIQGTKMRRKPITAPQRLVGFN